LAKVKPHLSRINLLELLPVFKNKIFHPFLLALYPVLALLAHNIEEIKFVTGLRALIVAPLGAAILFALLRLVVRDHHHAALLCSLALVLFFSYGHLYNYLEQNRLLGFTLGRHRYLLPIWGGLLLLGTLLVLRRDGNLAVVTRSVNMASAFLLIWPIVQLLSFAGQVVPALSQEQQPAQNSHHLSVQEGQIPPDVYYIILDSYTRGDVFQEIYEFDNTSFLEQLRGLGFYVASCSQANYSQTRLSLASSLNMEYLDAYLGELNSHGEEMARLLPLAHHSAVRQALEGLGYVTVSFETGHIPTQWEDTDYYLSPQGGLMSEAQNFGRLSEFEVMLLQNSAGLLLTDAASGLPQLLGNASRSYWQIYRERILYTIDRLEAVPEIPGPKFVFAHILAPHPPYVFEADGKPVEEEKGKIIGYRDQVAYVNTRMFSVLEAIIIKSNTPPVIILQGDHGPDSFAPQDRMAILNAYYLPRGVNDLLYTNISPVNSFRVVFNSAFAGDFPLLDDRSYYTLSREPYEFELIPNVDENCQDF
jgi:hypothetical protein